MRNILVINGNPARERATFSAALADAYAEGAQKPGHKVKQVTLAALAFDPILHEGNSKDQPLETDLQMVREAMVQAEHWVLVFPLWHSLPPALVKGFIERTMTRGFAFEYKENRAVSLPALEGKTLHIIITCGMPSFVYRWFSGAPASKALRTLFKVCGMRVTGISVFGSVAEHSPKALKRYDRYLDSMRQLGECM